MQIIQELKQGTPKFTVSGAGTETVQFNPPTSKELRAARALEGLIAQLEGLIKANALLEQTTNHQEQVTLKLQEDLNKANTAVSEFTKQVQELIAEVEKLRENTSADTAQKSST